MTTSGIGPQSGGRRGYPILPIRGYHAAALVAGLVGVYILYFWRLGVCPLLPPNEGLYSEIAREMNETGDYITPHLNYLRYYEKPPLFYWCTAASFRLFGESEASARLVSALSGVGIIFLTMLLGSLLCGKRLGALSGVIVGSSLGMMGMCRLTMLDPLLTLWVTLAFLGFTIAYISPRRPWGYPLCSAAFALALMTKGPVAVILGVPPMLAFITLTGGWRRWRGMMLWQSALVFVAIAAPWHVAVGLRDPNFAHFYFVNETIDRFIGTRVPADYYTGKPDFYVIRILFLFAPWAVLLPAAMLAWPYSRRFASGQRSAAELAAPAGAQPDASLRDRTPFGAMSYLLGVLWFAWPVIFFTLAKNKANYYLLPTSPAQALLVGRLLCLLDRPGGDTAYVPRRLASASLALLAAGVLYGLYRIEARPDRTILSLDPASHVGMVWAMRAAVACWVAGGLVGILHRPRERLAGLLALGTVSLVLATGSVVARAVDKMPSSKRAAEVALQYADGRAPIILDGTYEGRSTAGFYLRRRLACIDARNGDLWFGSTLEPCDEWFPAAADIVERARHGERLVIMVPRWERVRFWLTQLPDTATNRGRFGDVWILTMNT